MGAPGWDIFLVVEMGDDNGTGVADEQFLQSTYLGGWTGAQSHTVGDEENHGVRVERRLVAGSVTEAETPAVAGPVVERLALAGDAIKDEVLGLYTKVFNAVWLAKTEEGYVEFNFGGGTFLRDINLAGSPEWVRARAGWGLLQSLLVQQALLQMEGKMMLQGVKKSERPWVYYVPGVDAGFYLDLFRAAAYDESEAARAVALTVQQFVDEGAFDPTPVGGPTAGLFAGSEGEGESGGESEGESEGEGEENPATAAEGLPNSGEIGGENLDDQLNTFEDDGGHVPPPAGSDEVVQNLPSESVDAGSNSSSSPPPQDEPPAETGLTLTEEPVVTPTGSEGVPTLPDTSPSSPPLAESPAGTDFTPPDEPVTLSTDADAPVILPEISPSAPPPPPPPPPPFGMNIPLAAPPPPLAPGGGSTQQIQITSESGPNRHAVEEVLEVVKTDEGKFAPKGGRINSLPVDRKNTIKAQYAINEDVVVSVGTEFVKTLSKWEEKHNKPKQGVAGGVSEASAEVAPVVVVEKINFTHPIDLTLNAVQKRLGDKLFNSDKVPHNIAVYGAFGDVSAFLIRYEHSTKAEIENGVSQEEARSNAYAQAQADMNTNIVDVNSFLRQSPDKNGVLPEITNRAGSSLKLFHKLTDYTGESYIDTRLFFLQRSDVALDVVKIGDTMKEFTVSNGKDYEEIMKHWNFKNNDRMYAYLETAYEICINTKGFGNQKAMSALNPVNIHKLDDANIIGKKGLVLFANLALKMAKKDGYDLEADFSEERQAQAKRFVLFLQKIKIVYDAPNFKSAALDAVEKRMFDIETALNELPEGKDLKAFKENTQRQLKDHRARIGFVKHFLDDIFPEFRSFLHDVNSKPDQSGFPLENNVESFILLANAIKQANTAQFVASLTGGLYSIVGSPESTTALTLAALHAVLGEIIADPKSPTEWVIKLFGQGDAAPPIGHAPSPVAGVSVRYSAEMRVAFRNLISEIAHGASGAGYYDQDPLSSVRPLSASPPLEERAEVLLLSLDTPRCPAPEPPRPAPAVPAPVPTAGERGAAGVGGAEWRQELRQFFEGHKADYVYIGLAGSAPVLADGGGGTREDHVFSFTKSVVGLCILDDYRDEDIRLPVAEPADAVFAAMGLKRPELLRGVSLISLINHTAGINASLNHTGKVGAPEVSAFLLDPELTAVDLVNRALDGSAVDSPFVYSPVYGPQIGVMCYETLRRHLQLQDAGRGRGRPGPIFMANQECVRRYFGHLDKTLVWPSDNGTGLKHHSWGFAGIQMTGEDMVNFGFSLLANPHTRALLQFLVSPENEFVVRNASNAGVTPGTGDANLQYDYSFGWWLPKIAIRALGDTRSPRYVAAIGMLGQMMMLDVDSGLVCVRKHALVPEDAKNPRNLHESFFVCAHIVMAAAAGRVSIPEARQQLTLYGSH